MILRFRVLDKRTNSFYNSFGENNCILYLNCNKNGSIEISEYNENYELMQSTGLFDKNGVEIFEGDVVKYKKSGYSKVEEVRFEHGAFIAGYHTGSSTRKRPKLIRGDRLEVIGNIYQNKELLGGK